MSDSKLKVKVKKAPKTAIKKLTKVQKALTGPRTVKVGFPRGSNDYPDGTSLIMVAAVNEFGSDENNVPERSFLRSTVTEQRKKYSSFAKKSMKKIVAGETTAEKALGLMGLMVQTDVRQKIVDISEPPLKHRDGNPLVDTGHMLQSVVFEVS